MMIKKKIEDGLYMLSMNVDDMFFESMWELPHGVTMNSYIVKGDKIAIIDGVTGWDGVPESLYKQLGEIDINPEDIEYLVINHLEPDHSGWIDDFKKINNQFTVVTTAKGEPILKAFYGEDMKVMVVNEGDTLDLGNGKKLSFHPTPNVHWPETMLTYEENTKTLFSCDMYGAFGVIDDHYFDDEMTDKEQALFEEEVIRYYSNVMATFSPMVKRAITKTKEFDLKLIAPGHGPLYRGNIEKIINDYSRFADYAKGGGQNEIAILWGSMYGATKQGVDHAEAILKQAGIKVNSIHMPYDTASDMVSNVFKSAAVIVAASTYEYKMFPPVAHAIDELGRKKITGKEAIYFGSFGWNSGAKKDFQKIMDGLNMKWNVTDYIEFEGIPKTEDLKKIEEALYSLIEHMKEKVTS
jgi:flavorubredoxin